MKKNLIRAAVCLLMAIIPLFALASSVYFPDQGVSIDFPANVDVLSLNMDANDPVLALYGKTADEVTRELKSGGLCALAYDIAGNFTIKLCLKNRSAQSFDRMSDQELKEFAGRYGGSKYELYQSAQASFLLIYGDSGRALIALANQGGVQVELRLAAKGKISKAMIKTMKDIAARTSLPQSQ